VYYRCVAKRIKGENFIGDQAQEYFVDGMTDALITELAQITDVRVISRTSVMRYKEARKSDATPIVGQELNVDAIVTESSPHHCRPPERCTSLCLHAR
jgi:TolB-like protein